MDISVAVTERTDEAELMGSVVKLLASSVEVPLVIDSTETEVMEVALKTAPGRCLINSTHLEGGRSKADQVFELSRQHNAAVLVLTIDEEGMAKTAQRKLDVARRIYDIAVQEHGLKAEDLVFDTLTFTLATGDPDFSNSAIETIEGLATGNDLHPIQEAFVEKGAIQCGFCTPGMVLSAKAFLAKNGDPTEEQVREGISGNLCRCTGYEKIVEAVLAAASKMKEKD